MTSASCAAIAVCRTASLPVAYDPRIRLHSELMDCRVKPAMTMVAAARISFIDRRSELSD
jgi:hypothetical protein